ncbi:MAG: flagellar basal body-associated FliL family protein [Deltaproteobacteria bacterium]|nr:flagellar basal body-associated FliL family protein [Deltaproteobacteria bacterium]MBI3294566.1 flagellar basal body-associated FliL family protein [Deltaproteobacteria bacterium]
MNLTRVIAVVLAVATSALASYLLKASMVEWNDLPALTREPASVKGAGEVKRAEEGKGHGAKGEGHAPETAPAEGGHGEGDGEHASAGEGPPVEDPLSVNLDEFMINIGSQREPEKAFSVGMKLELQLFEGADSANVKSSLSGIRNAVIEVTRGQDYYHLKTTAGKLYFKEVLIERINSFLNASAVRDVRFAALLFQK